MRGPVVGELSARCYLSAGGGGNPPGDRGRAGQGVATLGTTPALLANEEPHSRRTCGTRTTDQPRKLSTHFILVANLKKITNM